MDLQHFNSIEFPASIGSGYVYVLCWISGADESPFYVGQTKSIWRRLGEYYWAQFSACTDFRVCEAIKHFHTRGYRVVARYTSSEALRLDERRIITELHSEGKVLLNDIAAYNYRTADEGEERSRVQRFVDERIEAINPGA